MNYNLSKRLCASKSVVQFRDTVRQAREEAYVPCFGRSLGSSQPSPSISILVLTLISKNFKLFMYSSDLKWLLMPEVPVASWSLEKICSDCWRTWERQRMWEFLGCELDSIFMVCATVSDTIIPKRRVGPLPLTKPCTNAPSYHEA